MNAVIGAFGYTGRAIARRLLESGEVVITLTGHPSRRHDFGAAVQAFPFCFDRPEAMAESLRGVRVLYNTYWIRFQRGAETHNLAVARSKALLRAAELAGVERVVHISISNPDRDSPLPYFRGKALVEEAVQAGRFSHAIVRPTVIFGGDDILVNNIAFLLRNLPLFLIPGDGNYRLQPVFIEDLATIAVDAGRASGNFVVEAAGPEIVSFNELLELIRSATGSHARLLHAPPSVVMAAGNILGAVLRDVVLTEDEARGLMANLLVPAAAPAGSTRFREWLTANAATVGRHYASELRRHYKD